MVASLDEKVGQPEASNSSGPFSDAELKTAINSTLRSRSGTSTRTAQSTSTSLPAQESSSEITVFSLVKTAFSYLLLAVLLYVGAVVSVFHVAYFTRRNPSVAKDLFYSAFKLLKTTYDAKLLTISEIYMTVNTSIIQPMARQNNEYFLEENQRTAQLQTMQTSPSSFR